MEFRTRRERMGVNEAVTFVMERYAAKQVQTELLPYLPALNTALKEIPQNSEPLRLRLYYVAGDGRLGCDFRQ